jgi:hypothetical protein
VRQELSAPAIAIMGYAEMLMDDAVQADREQLSPSGSKTHTGGTSAAASPFCLLASRKSADGENTDEDEGNLFSRIGASSPFFLSANCCIVTACQSFERPSYRKRIQRRGASGFL